MLKNQVEYREIMKDWVQSWLLQLVIITNNAKKIQRRIEGPVRTTPEEYENGGFTRKTYQMFSVHTKKKKEIYS